MARRKSPPSSLIYTGIGLRREQLQQLQQLSARASDEIGTRISHSQIVRGLLHWIAAQPPNFFRVHLRPAIEAELKHHTWGYHERR